MKAGPRVPPSQTVPLILMALFDVSIVQEHFYLCASQREVVSTLPRAASIVCGEDNQSVVIHFVMLQCSGHIANSFIHCSNHAIVGSPILVLNFEGKKLLQLRMNHSYLNVLIMFFIGLGDLQGIMWIL